MESTPPVLSPEQTRVSTARAPGLCVIAGPGSGKTTTLVQRYAFLLTMHSAADIILITFTRNAARHLREKIEAAGLPTPGYCGTLHGYARRIVSGTMLETEDSDAILKDTAAKLKCKDGVEVLRRILTGLAEGTDLQKIVIRRFRGWLRQERLCDTDTLLIDLRDHLQQQCHPPVGALLVDEAQDSGTMDWQIYDLIRTLSKTFVGDPDQSMYGFRGGRPDLLLSYGDRPGVSTVYLNDNYRSTPGIVAAANALTGRKLQSTRQDNGAQIVAVILPSHYEEEAQIAKLVKDHIESGRTSTIAILCRYNAEVKRLRQRLTFAGAMPPEEESSVPKDWRLATATIRHLADPGNAILRNLWGKAAGVHDLPPHTNIGQALLFSGVSKATTARIIRLQGNDSLGDLLETMREEVADPEPVRGQITVMTYHAAKGLEFDNVLLPGLDTLPGKLLAEEEKRCFFVALTRARNSVNCFAVRSRVNEYNGQMDKRCPSPFMAIIASRTIEPETQLT